MKTPLDFYLSGLIIGVVFGSGLTLSVITMFSERINYAVIPLSDAEKSAALMVTPMPTTEVVVRFESDEEWTKHLFGSGTIGYAEYYRSPCLIGLRSNDWSIRGRPSTGQMEFHSDDAEMSSTFGHEMLHCIRGLWHPNWGDIQKTQEESFVTIFELRKSRPRRDGD
jgi:hypothetical protein